MVIDLEIEKGKTNKYGHERLKTHGQLASIVEKQPVDMHTLVKMAIGISKSYYSQTLEEFN